MWKESNQDEERIPAFPEDASCHPVHGNGEMAGHGKRDNDGAFLQQLVKKGPMGSMVCLAGVVFSEPFP